MLMKQVIMSQEKSPKETIKLQFLFLGSQQQITNILYQLLKDLMTAIQGNC